MKGKTIFLLPSKNKKKIVKRFLRNSLVMMLTVCMLIWSMSAFMGTIFPPAQKAEAFTFQTMSDTEVNQKLGTDGALLSVLKFVFGTSEATQTLSNITLTFTNVYGASWTNGAETSSELADLAIANGGVQLWKSNAGQYEFASTTATQVTLTSTPIYSGSTFVINPATDPTLADGDIYFVVLKSDVAAATTDGAQFRVGIAQNGHIVTSGTDPVVAPITTDIIMIDETAPTISSIESNRASGVLQTGDKVAVKFSEEMDSSTITSPNINTSLALTGAVSWGTGTEAEWGSGSRELTITIGTTPGTITVGTTEITPAATVKDKGGIGYAAGGVVIGAAVAPTISSIKGGVGKVIVTFSENVLDFYGNFYYTGTQPKNSDFTFTDASGGGLQVQWINPVPSDSYENMVRNALEIKIATSGGVAGNPTTSDILTLNTTITDQARNAYAGSATLAISVVDTTAPTAVTNVVLADTDATASIDGRDVTISWTAAASDTSFRTYKVYLVPASETFDPWMYHPIAVANWNVASNYLTTQGAATTRTVVGKATLTTDSRYSFNNSTITGISYKAYVIAEDVLFNSSPTAASSPATLVSDVSAAAGDVVINELVADPQRDWSTNNFTTVGAGAVNDGADEWVELYIKTSYLNISNWAIAIDNATSTVVDISSRIDPGASFGTIRYLSSNNGTTTNTRAGDYMVLGGLSGNNSTTQSGFTITLKDGIAGNTIDTVIFTNATHNATSTNAANEAFARDGASTDTNNIADWTKTTATLGAANTSNDSAGPTVVSATGVLGTGNLKVVFSESLNPFSIATNTSFTLDNSLTVSSSELDLTTDPSGKTARLYLTAGQVLPNAQITVTVAEGTARDIAGNAIGSSNRTASFYPTQSTNSDTIAPIINHMPIGMGAPTTDIDFVARVTDSGGSGLKYVRLFYKNPTALPYSQVDMAPIENGFYRYTFDSSALGFDSTDIKYYIKAEDNAGNIQTMPMDVMNGQDYGFWIARTSTSAGTNTVSVTVNDGTNAVTNAIVFLGGYGSPAFTHAGSGVYTLANVPNGWYMASIIAPGFMPKMIDSIDVHMNTTIATQSLTSTSGDTANPPTVTRSGPRNGDTFVPTDIFNIFIGFSEPMKESTINASNIVVTGGSVAVSGTVTYDSYMNEARFSPSAALSPSTTYIVTVSPSVQDSSSTNILAAHTFSFTTGSAYSTTSGNYVNTAPPFVKGTTPMGGQIDVALNTKISIEFNKTMNQATLTNQNVRIYYAGSTNSFSDRIQWTTNSYDSTTNVLTITLPAALPANSEYKIEITSSVTDSSGIVLGGGIGGSFFNSFKTGSANDTTKPTVIGTYPCGSIASSTPVIINDITIGFSEAMAASTIIDSDLENGGNITFKVGSTNKAGRIEYDSNNRMAHIIPKTALTVNTQYTVTITTSVTDLNGNAINTNYSFTFITEMANSDITPPEVMFANADTFGLAVTFSEPMNASSTTGTFSVTNPSNYTLYSPWNSSTNAGTQLSLSGKTITWDGQANTAKFQSLSLNPGATFKLIVANVKDLSEYAISSAMNFTIGTVMDSANTQGMLGPGQMMGTMDMHMMGEMPVGVWPMNSMASATTQYFIDIPLATQIPVGGKIVLTFPQGFDVTNATSTPTTESYANQDINGPGTGTVTIATVTKNVSARSITITTGGSATKATADAYSGKADFLHFDLKGIANSSVPRDYGTSGYTVDIKTKNTSNIILESLVSMPIFISAPGTNNITITVNATGIGNATTAYIYGGSPMTGPLDQQIIFNQATTGTAQCSGNVNSMTCIFNSMPNGSYNFFMEPIITTSTKSFLATNLNMEPIYVTGTGGSKTFTFEDDSAAGFYKITGTISGGPANEKLQVWAGNPRRGKWIQKDVTLNGSGTVDYVIPVKLEAETSEENWDVGVNPWMPKGPMMMGPAPEPSFIPPSPKNIKVASNNPGTNSQTKLIDYSGATPAISVITNATNAVVSGNAIDFALSTADQRIKGYVVDGSNRAISGAEVYAYNPGGMGMGAHTQTGTDGAFSLKVGTGMYTVGANKPGMPYASEIAVEVKANSSNLDGNTNADIYKNRVLISDASGNISTATNPLSIKMSRPDYTITGKVTDGSTGVANASVWAYQTNAPGHAQTNTDSSGNYTLYVTSGTWTVEANAPGYGFLGSKSATVSSSATSASLSAFTPATNLGTISGTVAGLTTNANVNIWAEGTGASAGNKNNAVTNSSGAYTLQVPYGIYTIYAWAPEIGKLPPVANVTVDAGHTAVTGKNFDVSATILRTVQIKFKNSANADYSVTNAFVDFTDPTSNFENDLRITNATSSTLTLPDGSYYVNLHMDGVDTASITKTGLANGVLVVDGTSDIVTCTLPALFTVSGQVTVGGVGENNTFVWLESTANRVHINYNTVNNAAGGGKDGEYTISVPAGTYTIGVGKPGYTGPNPTSITVAANTTQNLIMTANDYSISGRVWYDTDGDGSYDSGEGVNNAWLWGDKAGGGWAGTETDANGNYELSVAEGDWTINTNARGYASVQYASKITVVGANQTSKNLQFTTTATLTPPASYPIVPSAGGVIDDTATGGTGVKITIPANALGADSTAAQVTIEPTAIESTDSRTSLQTFTIKATDSSGSAITTLNDDIDIEFVYSKANVDSFLSANSITIAQLADASIDYKNTNTGSNWASSNVVFKPTADGSTVADMDTFAEDFNTYTTYTLTVKATTDHLSDYALNIPSDASAPATPSGLAVTPSTSGTPQNVLVWTANTEGDLAGYYIYRSTDGGTNYPLLTTIAAGTQTYTNTDLTGGTTYYYRIAAYDTSTPTAKESASCTAVSGKPAASGGYVPPTSSSPNYTYTPPTTATETTTTTTTETTTETTAETTNIPTSASTHNDGTLIKSATSPEIYVIKKGKKVWIPTWEAFVAGGYLMSQVQTVAASEITATSPAKLIKSADSPKVYLIENGKKRHINDPQVFSNSGYSWDDVVTVENANANAYTVSNLIRVAGHPEVYQLAINTKRHIPNPEVFNAYKYGWNNIMEVTQKEADAYSDIVLIRVVGDYKVYLMQNRIMQWVKNPIIFASYNYRWEDIVEINATERAIYTEGAVIDTAAQADLLSKLVKFGKSLLSSF